MIGFTLLLNQFTSSGTGCIPWVLGAQEAPPEYIAKVPGLNGYQERTARIMLKDLDPEDEKLLKCSVLKMMGKSVHLQDMLLDKCKFLSETLGRGGFYIFQGTLWLCFAPLSYS